MKYLANVTTLEFSPEKCTGCGRCVEVCPHGVFEINEKKAHITDKDLCMECGACTNNCEFGAIKVNSGVGCASAVINSILYGGEPACDCNGTDSKSACC
ncbi:ferredoxin-1 [bacterium BMS3Abin07]|nr:ferredoxin-1 [bacterium BMS3Abin07]GBE31205.1 ferredoxin-1 [bacterium BMS3Bbin05]HDL20897.1 4Fe-4S dicluster domain-containing protein [Nitrospirota bacterium]HDO22410.1 4Fe-4S dicluster domain-containing protein [Nitrospirota bacterium]HDZ88936.1 4Fe-4S dicluster domain-containing protein [Nitrospirota bacterium]